MMAHVDWSLKGPEITNCNCNWGCPCQFNSLPSHGGCRAVVGGRIDEGHFGDVRLDGLCWAYVVAWPGAIHQGRGECQFIIDERADAPQREALLSILSGKETEPFATFFNVFASTMERVHEPLFRPITFEADLEARMGRISVPGVVETVAEPIRNPVTGNPHRARLVLPHGFEFHEAEFASGRTSAAGAIAHDWTSRHTHLAMLHLTPTGPVH